MEWGEHLTPERARELSEDQEGMEQPKYPCPFCEEPWANLPQHIRVCDERENSDLTPDSDEYGTDIPEPDV